MPYVPSFAFSNLPIHGIDFLSHLQFLNNPKHPYTIQARQDLPTPIAQRRLDLRNHTSSQSGAVRAVKLAPAQHVPAGSKSDDGDAYSRRKAQNRAAQRAFRGRKERHVKELEAKVVALEAMQQQNLTENAQLKRDLLDITTENEILRAISNLSRNGTMNPASNPIAKLEEAQRLITAEAAWDLLVRHAAFERGLIDVGNVSERLKLRVRCNGQGPVLEESSVLQAIEESMASDSDELW